MAKKDDQKTENKEYKKSDSQELESAELQKLLMNISKNLETQNQLLQNQVQNETSQAFSNSALEAVKSYSEITAALRVLIALKPESAT